MADILIVGLPRSGTTWVARMLAHAPATALVFEPDNHAMLPYATRAKRSLPGAYYPDPDGAAPRYSLLWQAAFRRGRSGRSATCASRTRRLLAQRLFARAGEPSVRAAFSKGGYRVKPLPTAALHVAGLIAAPTRPPPNAENVIVKSVYAVRSLEWVAAQLVPTPSVIVVIRDLRDVIASWDALGWIPDDADNDELAVADPRSVAELASRLGTPSLPRPASALTRTAWLLAVLSLSLDRSTARHPEWLVVRHQDLCADPVERFAGLAAGLGLEWTEACSAAVASTIRPGEGFQTNRLSASLPGSWRRRLTGRQVREVESALDGFPSCLAY